MPDGMMNLRAFPEKAPNADFLRESFDFSAGRPTLTALHKDARPFAHGD